MRIRKSVSFQAAGKRSGASSGGGSVCPLSAQRHTAGVGRRPTARGMHMDLLADELLQRVRQGRDRHVAGHGAGRHPAATRLSGR